MPRAERVPEGVEVRRSEHHAVARGDVDEVQVDPGLRDLPRQVGQDARPVVHLHDDDLALATHRQMRDRAERVPHRLGVLHEDVQLGPVARADTGRRRDVHARVADRLSHLASAPGLLSTSMTRSTAIGGYS